ncbi:SANT/Myb_domain [Hexamita inflata]|uniref:SANT/Myb domain n=1 Tax=Hexamita inflata TaxID=28002 RepID=A0AA86Q9H2_9EUKA|nr:SANT/Myb domain [Hexamita inflata]
MNQELVLRKMDSNIQLLQQVHDYVHQIQQLKYSSSAKLRWTAQENQLLEYALQAFGADIKRIQQMIISKTAKQIYFRIHYIKQKAQ